MGLAVDHLRAFWGWPDAWERSEVRPRIDAFVPSVQSVVPEHRLEFRFNELKVVPLESETVHVEVAERALRLAHRQGRERVEDAHRDALGEVGALIVRLHDTKLRGLPGTADGETSA